MEVVSVFNMAIGDEGESLGCGKEIYLSVRCGEPNAWGKEYLCKDCLKKWGLSSN